MPKNKVLCILYSVELFFCSLTKTLHVIDGTKACNRHMTLGLNVATCHLNTYSPCCNELHAFKGPSCYIQNLHSLTIEIILAWVVFA